MICISNIISFNKWLVAPTSPAWHCRSIFIDASYRAFHYGCRSGSYKAEFLLAVWGELRPIALFDIFILNTMIQNAAHCSGVFTSFAMASSRYAQAIKFENVNNIMPIINQLAASQFDFDARGELVIWLALALSTLPTGIICAVLFVITGCSRNRQLLRHMRCWHYFCLNNFAMIVQVRNLKWHQ